MKTSFLKDRFLSLALSTRLTLLVALCFGVLGLWAQSRQAAIEPSTQAATVASATPAPTLQAFENAEQLRESYARLASKLWPNYNGIDAKLERLPGGGFALLAHHVYFSEYTFAAGAEARLIEQYALSYASELKRFNVRRVGVYGVGDYASGVWYFVK